MTATLDDVAKKKPTESAEQEAAAELVRQAKERGLSLTGPDGLLKQLTKSVIEAALSEEMTEHLGYEKNDPAGIGSANVRNGTRSKTVLTENTGNVEIDVPRDRAGSFEPQIVKKRQRRLNGVDEIVLSLYAKGLTTGEIGAHFAEIYGASVSKETISRITDRVLEEMQAWQTRPLDEIYTAIFIDAIVVKVRDGQVANRPIYAAIGVNLEGERDILGLWSSPGGEGAKFWMAVLTDLRSPTKRSNSHRSTLGASSCVPVLLSWPGQSNTLGQANNLCKLGAPPLTEPSQQLPDGRLRSGESHGKACTLFEGTNDQTDKPGGVLQRECSRGNANVAPPVTEDDG
jgi:hypothetical protein